MDPPPAPASNGLQKTDSNYQASEGSQTAQDFIASQLSLEADAREALPYQFDTCTKPMGALKQSVYACLTCNPPPASPHQKFTPAGVCYSCSIECHGEHNLVELFAKRDFECDCGTTRFSNTGTPCNLRYNTETNRKGGVTGEKAREANKYNQNFEGLFCGCKDVYDPNTEKGTMFQCLGLGTVEEGGCGEDWWHPECLMGLPRVKHAMPETKTNGTLDIIHEKVEAGTAPAYEEKAEAKTENVEETGLKTEIDEELPEDPAPDGFPDEDDFDQLICCQCVNAFPWIKQYANSSGFLTAGNIERKADRVATEQPVKSEEGTEGKKRKAEDDMDDLQDTKRAKSSEPKNGENRTDQTHGHAPSARKHELLPPAPTSDGITLFCKEDFRDHFCRCPECFPRLAKHKQLLEEEEAYEPPLSESDDGSEVNGHGAPSINSGSLLDRGEAALSSMDRVRAIEGVMAYNHVRDKVKDFLKPYAESGTPVGAEDIKAYFAKLRGDEQAMREAAGRVSRNDDRGEKDNRREQGGY